MNININRLLPFVKFLNRDKKKLTFVLTLALSDTGRDESDLERINILFKSFNKYFDSRFIDRFYIVTPTRDEKKVKKSIKSKLKSHKFEILNENIICPELKHNPDTYHPWPKPNNGWYRQQLIKLAVHEYVTTPFYMTLDSDVIFIKKFTPKSIISDGRALLNLQRRNDYENIYRKEIAQMEVDIRKERYKDVESILKCSRPIKYSEQWYGETPVLLNKYIVSDLASHIEQIWGQPWREVLLNKLPWTEYALYFLYAEQSGKLEQNYVLGNIDSILSLSKSLWLTSEGYKNKRSLDNWNIENVFNDGDESIAVVVQSYLGYSVLDLSQKIQNYIK